MRFLETAEASAGWEWGRNRYLQPKQAKRRTAILFVPLHRNPPPKESMKAFF